MEKPSKRFTPYRETGNNSDDDSFLDVSSSSDSSEEGGSASDHDDDAQMKTYSERGEGEARGGIDSVSRIVLSGGGSTSFVQVPVEVNHPVNDGNNGNGLLPSPKDVASTTSSGTTTNTVGGGSAEPKIESGDGEYNLMNVGENVTDVSPTTPAAAETNPLDSFGTLTLTDAQVQELGIDLNAVPIFNHTELLAAFHEIIAELETTGGVDSTDS